VTRHTMPLTSPAELVAVGLSADRTIAVSHAVARALRRRLYPAGRLRVVPNGIELARVDAVPSEQDMAAARAALGDLAGRPVVLVLARRKDQHVLLRGLAGLERPVVVACVGIEADPELRGIEPTLPARIAWCTCRSRTAHSRFVVWPRSRRCRRASRGFLSRCSRRWRWGCRSSHQMPVGTRNLITSGETGVLVPPARPRGLGAGSGARAGRSGVRRADRTAGPRARPQGIHAAAHGRADRSGVPGSPRAAPLARRRSIAPALSTTLLLALNFPPSAAGSLG